MCENIKRLLLRREHLVYVRPELSDSSAHNFAQFEYDLLCLGFVAGADLQQRLRSLPEPSLAEESSWVLSSLKADVGADVAHVPLFRSFPENVPEDTTGLFVARLMSYIFQKPDQPCLFCRKVNTVMALDPCAHLVCRSCFDGSNYSACPICNRRIALDSPFLQPDRFRAPETAGSSCVSLKLLHLCSNKDKAAQNCFAQLVSRQIVLSEADRSDLALLVQCYPQQILEWLPAVIPLKENMATVFGTMLKIMPDSAESVFSAATPYLRGATDLLRLIAVFMDASPGLKEYPRRMKSFKRQTRRLILAAIENFDIEQVMEDMLRRKSYWKAVGERLHVFESHKQFPGAAAAFALLRNTNIDGNTELGAAIVSVVSKHPDCLSLDSTGKSDGARLRFRTWTGRLELALRSADMKRTLELLEQRPGEFFRRLDQVYRKIVKADPAFAEQHLRAFSGDIGKASAQVLLTLLPHLRMRVNVLARRVFFPSGNVARAFVCPDGRAALPEPTIAQLLQAIEQELLRRASSVTQFHRAIIDREIEGLLLPFQERTASRALVSVPRGSLLPLPESGKFRLFLHWLQPEEQRVDLDLSLGFFGEDWQPAGRCDFTSLKFSNGAVHSGDLTSAPPPLGASEFVDLDIARLLEAGVRYAVMLVFSYTCIDFDRLPEAFAGLMDLHGSGDKIFDARKVQQRFDLKGASQVAVPMIVDLKKQTMLWTDMNLSPSGRFRDVRSNQKSIAYLGLCLTSYFSAGARMNMWEAACLQAAACTGDVQIRMTGGVVYRYIKGSSEEASEFYKRIVSVSSPDAISEVVDSGREPVLMFAMRDDVPVPAASQVYALRWEELSAENVRRFAAGDLLNAFACSSTGTVAESQPSGSER